MFTVYQRKQNQTTVYGEYESRSEADEKAEQLNKIFGVRAWVAEKE
jgi:hypothetical protein